MVCIGDCGITPLEGGMPISPHRMTWKGKELEPKENFYQIQTGKCILNVNGTSKRITKMVFQERNLPENPKEEGHSDMKMVS